ncbi:T9SS type A sorting domain-containing protein [Flavobacterium rhizosphaerae]|uniref:T9SS type A sorting domain-containing protein n=1 Tax=Flavobacterium rhizosphaerae TaxID=3163298 RepID=A0ABW8Z215_9FLAO
MSIIGHITVAQVTLIPDAAFEEVLIDLGIDSDGEINGQVLTSDIENVTELDLNFNFSLQSLTGIQDFTSLESLILHHTSITDLDVSQNLQLKILNCSSTWLTELDLSHNILLEELYAGNGYDVGPFNEITELDLSNNPNIKIIQAHNDYALDVINLKNGNNSNAMIINVSFESPEPVSPDYVYNAVCIQVDDEEAAQNNAYPYSEWNIDDLYVEVSLLENCTLGMSQIKEQTVTIYPNPANDRVYFDVPDGLTIDAVQLFDVMGRQVKEITAAAVSVSGLEAGTYFIKIFSGSKVQTEKLIVQ